MHPGVVVLIAAVVVVLLFGFYRVFTDGRFGAVATAAAEGSTDGGGRPDPVEEALRPLAETEWETEVGSRATLLQFSSDFCAPCRAAQRVLAAVAADEPGVAHVEVDVAQHLDLVERVGVVRTPTTLILDATGREITRAAGAPTRQQVLAALAMLPDA